jgi:hypothetical protein
VGVTVVVGLIELIDDPEVVLGELGVVEGVVEGVIDVIIEVGEVVWLGEKVVIVEVGEAAELVGVEIDEI